MYLVIAEKPSVSKAIAEVIGASKKEEGYLEGKGCIVSWCFGHLAEYVPPDSYDERFTRWLYEDLPIIPEEWKLAVSKDKKEQFYILKKLLNRPDIEFVVNACDAGREGELIFKHVYDLSGSKKPVKRLWISSLESSSILEGMEHLKAGETYHNLAEAAVCRAQADWLVGMNATRAYTTKYFKKLAVGRVQTPTLAVLVERQKQISGFKKEKYFNVVLDCDGLIAEKKKIFDVEEAERVWKTCQGSDAIVEKVESKEKTVKPPKLYDLTTLQREANRIYGMTAQQTLNAAQSLYEQKLITYPRTDSQYLTSDMEETAKQVIRKIHEKYQLLEPFDQPKTSEVKKVLNDKKVSDHHAIIPTIELAEFDFSKLREWEQKILFLIAVHTVEAMEADHKFYNVSAAKTEHFTAPPKPYSEDTLLAAMETAGNKEFEEDTEKKGLGTPATRAGIIEKLIASQYAVRKGKQILPTEDGKVLIEILPDFLKSATMTAEWENQLLEMEQGKMAPGQFMTGIEKLLSMMLNHCDSIPEEETRRFQKKESVGTCPVCGGLVYEGKKNFYCGNRACNFCLWKENKYLQSMEKDMDARMAAELLKNGSVHVKDLYSKKKDLYFEADLHMEADENGRVTFSLSFPERKTTKKNKKK